MPAAEAAQTDERDVLSYELAFHVLPTVAEGEVEGVFAQIKKLITDAGGEITSEEAPARFELAYEIVKYLEGRNRKFSSAYFGWVRFTLDPTAATELSHEVEAMKEILRSLMIRLTKMEEENPFEFHPSVASKRVENIEVSDEEASDEDDSSDDAATEPESDEASADDGDES